VNVNILTASWKSQSGNKNEEITRNYSYISHDVGHGTAENLMEHFSKSVLERCNPS